MRFKIELNLNENDFKRIKEVLDKNPSTSLELFPYQDFEFAAISPLSITAEGFGYSINGMVSFQQPIGMKVFDRLKLEKQTSKHLSINYRNIKLTKIVTEANELENDLNESLNLLEKIFNQVCHMQNILIEKTLTINTESLDKQLESIIRAKELNKRAEVPKPFGTIHAQGRKDAKERSGPDLVPIYMEKDKAYLYEDKKIFILLPRKFVRKLLKMDHSTLVPSDQFTEQEIDILKKFSMRKYIKKNKVAGKTFYHDLDEKTRKLLIKGMKTSKF
ncbi:MAG TPA: hypothetical protein ENN36_07200 [Candidatus Bathyarchaeota archaeon]|nr:hypothetical protein [Candidatus Bathyarchaeota archaeon]